MRSISRSMRSIALAVLVSFTLQILGAGAALAQPQTKFVQLNLGQSTIVQFEGTIKRVSLGNPAIADYNVISKNEVMVLAMKAGNTELYAWLEDGAMITYDLKVIDDLAELRLKLVQVLGPKAAARVSMVLAKETVILKGIVDSQFEADQAQDVAELFYKCMNLLEVRKDAPPETAVTAGMTVGEAARTSLEESYRDATDKTSRIFTLRYAQAPSLKTMLEKVKSPDGYLEVDERTNSLVVIDKPAVVQRITSILNVLDQSEPQIMIEAKVIEVSLGNDMTSAFDWIFESMYSGTNVLGTRLNDKGAKMQNGTLDLSLDYGKVSNDHFTANVLPQLVKRHSRLVSNPSIVTQNRKKSVIDISDQIPYLTYTPQGATGTLVATPGTADAGIKLEVTPTVIDDKNVKLELTIGVKSLFEMVSFPNYGTLPRLFGKTAQNVVTVPDGETLVIGGLIRDDMKDVNTKTPWFGNLPVIKNMFRNITNTNSRTELLLFVTPRLIYPNDTNNTVPSLAYRDVAYDEMELAAQAKQGYERYQKKYRDKYPLELPIEKKAEPAKQPGVGLNDEGVLLKEIPVLTRRIEAPAAVAVVKPAETAPAVTPVAAILPAPPTAPVVKPVATTAKSAKDAPLRSSDTRALLAGLKTSYEKKSQAVEAKPVAKAEAKPVAVEAKPVAKAEAKPVAAEAKPVAKVEAKSVAVEAKPVAKVEAKPVAVEAKPVAKVEAKPVAVETKPVAKAEAKPVAAEAKPVAKVEAKPEPVQASVPKLVPATFARQGKVKDPLRSAEARRLLEALKTIEPSPAPAPAPAPASTPVVAPKPAPAVEAQADPLDPARIRQQADLRMKEKLANSNLLARHLGPRMDKNEMRDALATLKLNAANLSASSDGSER